MTDTTKAERIERVAKAILPNPLDPKRADETAVQAIAALEADMLAQEVGEEELSAMMASASLAGGGRYSVLDMRNALKALRAAGYRIMRGGGG